MEDAHTLQLASQRIDQRTRQHGPPVLAALPVADRDLPPGKLHVLHPQARAAHQSGNRCMYAVEPCGRAPRLVRGQRHRQPNAGGSVVAHGISASELQARVNEDPFAVEGVVSAEILEITPAAADPRPDFLLG